MRRNHVILICLGVLGGCATLTASGGDRVTVITVPPGATCTIQRDGLVLAQGISPATLDVGRSSKYISATCVKPGFKKETRVLDARSHSRTQGNAVAGGLIGFALDAATAADYYYPDAMSMLLSAEPGTPEPVPPVGACPAAGTKVMRDGAPNAEYRGLNPLNWDTCVRHEAGRSGFMIFDLVDGFDEGAYAAYEAFRTVLGAPQGVTKIASILLRGATDADSIPAREVFTSLGTEAIEVDGIQRPAFKVSQNRTVYGNNGGEGTQLFWRDRATGMLLKKEYQHVRGNPVFPTGWKVVHIEAPPG